MKLNAGHMQARQLLALSLIALEEFKEAAAELEQLIKLTPPDASTFVALGKMYLRLKRHPEAVSTFKRALELEPKCSKDTFASRRSAG